jgi:phosphate starvation-inducible PhoH-like protein
MTNQKKKTKGKPRDRNLHIEDNDLLGLDTPKAPNFKINDLKFKSQKQKDYFDICRDEDTKLVICDGPAGTGKTLLSMYAALRLIKQGKYKNILYVRSAVDSAEQGLGFLPGDIDEKSHNYMIPLEEKLCKFLDYEAIKQLLNDDVIISTVNNFMRGRSIDDTIVIIDELQNFTLSEAKTLLSRFEENTKIIACGDKGQSDIGSKSCLTKLIKMFGEDESPVGDVTIKEHSEEQGVFTFAFDIEDVVRSGLTKYVLEVFGRNEKLMRS